MKKSPFLFCLVYNNFLMKVYNNHSLVNLSNSILKHFGVTPFHDTIPEIDELLKGHKKVCLILFDGMGKNIIRYHLKEKSFIRSHYVTTINSTYPPTTAAATTALLTGKYPIETGWLAWNTYFKELDRNIILFRGKDIDTGETLDDPLIAYKKFPITQIFDLINQKGLAKATQIMRYPVQEKGPKSLRKGAKMTKETLSNDENCFVYFYWDSPDREMHETGIHSFRTHIQVLKAQWFIKKVAKQNPDTLFIQIADHGHVNIKMLDICDHDDLYSLLANKVTMEKRTPSFFVKEENRKQFETLFNNYYGEHFELLSKEEVLKIKLFGEGTPNKDVIDSFGDYVAISKDEYGLTCSKQKRERHNFVYKGHHSGGTSEEREIDLSAYNI